MTLPKKEPLKTKICCACKKEKDWNSFYRNALMPSGWESRCKVCKNTRVSCRAKKSKVIKVQYRDAPHLHYVKKEDWIDTYDFLKLIGYDLTKNIHEQFCIKYNLEPKERTKEKSIQYSPKDLGLV